MVMEAICVLCQIPPIMNVIGKTQKVPNYWETSKKFLSDKDFLKTLINFDKDNIPDPVINRIRA
jgi:dynein heavy chain